MTDLATQIEQSGTEQQREMLEAAWLHIHGEIVQRDVDALITPLGPARDFVPDDPAAQKTLRLSTFQCLLDIGTDEAFTGAALMLVPEGLEWELLAYDVKRDPRFGRFQARIMLLRYEEDPEELGPQSIYNGHTPALAIAAACVRAHDKEDG